MRLLKREDTQGKENQKANKQLLSFFDPQLTPFRQIETFAFP